MSNLPLRILPAGQPFALWQRLRYTVLALCAALLAACGGGDDMNLGNVQASDCKGCGTALVTMTDAEGDFLSYTVDVTSLQLKKADGTVVETLPATSRIDFAQLVDLDEVLSASQIPAGEYVAATLKVDFSNAEIVVDDGTDMGAVVSPVGADGQPLTTVDLTVQLDNRNHLRIDAGRIGRLAFDLDLAASNTVDLTAGTVTVSPVMVASVVPPDTRDTRARGRLASVDAAGSTYTIQLRPFHENTHDLGQLVVHTTATTSFEINGTVTTGADGLAQLAVLTDQPLVIAFGTVSTSDHSFTASRVLAGSSIADAHRDSLSGNVLSRSGDTLTVGSVNLDRRDGRFGFQRGPVTVTVGSGTDVTRAGQASGALDSSAISVGQHIEAFGDLGRDSNGQMTLDATAGEVRLDYTKLFGAVVASSSGSLTLALQSIDGRAAARFDFAGTGATAADDADPAHYEVATDGLSSSALQPGAYTQLSGFVTAFGAAPPDFTAATFADFSSTNANLAIYWGFRGSVAPFTSTDDGKLTLDLTSGLHGAISFGGHAVDVLGLSGLAVTGGQITPSATAMPMSFAIAHWGSYRVENFGSYTDFATQLNTELDGHTSLISLFGYGGPLGGYDAVNGLFLAQRLLVVLGN